MSTSATSDQPQRPPSRNPHLSGTGKNMLWSTLAVAAAVLAFYALVARPDRLPRPTVDVHAVAQADSKGAGWSLAELQGLGEGWSPTVARLGQGTDGLTTWQARYVKGDDHYVAVYQARGATSGWLGDRTSGRSDAGDRRVGAVPVRAYTGGSSCTLVRRGGAGVTTVVETDGTCDEATAYAARLTPALR